MSTSTISEQRECVRDGGNRGRASGGEFTCQSFHIYYFISIFTVDADWLNVEKIENRRLACRVLTVNTAEQNGRGSVSS